MAYKIFDIGTVAIFIKEYEGGRSRILAFTLPEDRAVPSEFKVDDPVELSITMSHPAEIALGHNRGYYEIAHVPSGKTLKTFHKDDEWKVEGGGTY